MPIFTFSFPLPVRVTTRPAVFSAMRYRQGIETGARVYPFRLQPGRLSPYVGVSFRLLSYGHQTAGSSYAHNFPEVQRMLVPVQAGLTYTTAKYLFTAGVHYQTTRQLTYALSPTAFGTTSFNPVSVNVGLVRYIDSDKNLTQPKAVDQLNIKHELLKRNRRLSAWYAGIGPSAALPRPLSRSSVHSALPALPERRSHWRVHARSGGWPVFSQSRSERGRIVPDHGRPQ